MVRRIPFACRVGCSPSSDLWRQQCLREHLAEVEEYPSGSLNTPKSWRDLFFVGGLLPHLKVDLTQLQDLRAKKERRLEEISARMKSQRLEAEERKKQKEIKFTDRVPPMKRARGCESYRIAYLFIRVSYLCLRVFYSATEESVPENTQ
jgi:hypothetical protein